MAMSLEELLAKEGFKRRNARARLRISVSSEGRGTGRHDSCSKRTGRTRSHIPQYDSKGEFSSWKGKAALESNASGTMREIKGSSDSLDAKRLVIGMSEDSRAPEITEVVSNGEIVEVGMSRPYKDVYSNKVSGSRNSGRAGSRQMKQPQKVDKIPKVIDTFPVPAIDEVAVKAIISIVCSHIKCFVDDEDFRASLHRKTFASLKFISFEESPNPKSKVVKSLEQAIETVERAAETANVTSKELKKASMQLSVITGLNSHGTKPRIQDYIVSSCAHLYLSTIYVLQKKNEAAAKHLLQVFRDSPSEARTLLLPDLWEHLFLPHLSHLQLWYDKESGSLSDSPSLESTKLLEKAYNRSLDSGTYELATYYKDWLTKGVEVESPSVPIIKIPFFTVPLRANPSSRMSPKPMVSKKLYNEVFKHSHKSEVTSDRYQQENLQLSVRSSDSPAPVDKQLILYSGNSVTCTNQHMVPDDEFPSDINVPVVEQSCGLHPDIPSGLANLSKADEEFSGKCTLQSIPKDFLCPLTGLLFEDPVTLETGQTYEREAIVNWFDKGFLTCPVTRKPLQCQIAPPTNLILKRVLDKWKTDHFDHLLALLFQMSNDNIREDNAMVISIWEQLVAVHSRDEKIAIAKQILYFGGLQFLLRRFRYEHTHGKMLILQLLLYCIEADARCRNGIARNINPSNLLELLHSEQQTLRTNTVLLLIELVCSNRRIEAKHFVRGLLDEEIINTMGGLVMYLQSGLVMYLQTCSPELTPLVAVLLLHLSILSGTQKTSVYRQDAVEALAISMERGLTNEKLQIECSRALLILGGCFSLSGKVMTEDWILKMTGFLNGPDWDAGDGEANNGMESDLERVLKIDSQIKDGNEEENMAREKWVASVTGLLLEYGKRPFLDSITRCLSFGNTDTIRVCLTTAAWLSSSLASLAGNDIQLCAFSALFSPLKQCLANGELVEHQILASMSLYNFSKLPECRVLLMKFAEEMKPAMENLAEVTWTAKELHKMIT